MRFKPEIVALGLEVYPDNQVDKVRAAQRLGRGCEVLPFRACLLTQ
jgi:hypothetical protein